MPPKLDDIKLDVTAAEFEALKSIEERLNKLEAAAGGKRASVAGKV